MKILKSVSKAISISALILVCRPVTAQDSNPIILAMRDEMKRSMTEIKYEGHDKPFYISYGITDIKNFSVYATLGALVQSGEFKNRGKSVRVLVGDYEFNDESLDNNLFSEPTANEIQLPIEDDYFGIRRALWTTTDVVYKGAAEKFKKHQSTLREQGKSLNDLPHRTFAKVPVVQWIAPLAPYSLDQSKWENYCKALSAVFELYPDLESSDVIMNISYGSQYFVNSEGTVIVKPYHVAVIQCRAQIKTEKGEPVFDNIIHYASTPDQFPPLDQFKAESKGMAEKLISLQKSSALEEAYSGPVLLVGPSVAQAFASALFSFRESLVASNAILSTTDFRPEAATSLDSRMGKAIIDNAVTIKAKPKLKRFKDISLLGSYDVDDEGVVPEDELVLIENGVLKNLLNDRSLTKQGQAANGHSAGPAVIEVSSGKNLTVNALKEALIVSARKEGLDFAVIVRENAAFGEGMAEVWKVNLDTGNEEVLRSAQLGGLGLKNLKRIAGSAKELQAYTVQTGDGNLASFIVPEALLLDDVDITPLKLPYFEQEEIYVQSPLKR